MTSIARPDIVDRVMAAAADRARELAADERRLIAEDAVEVDVVVRTDRSSGDVVISRKGRSSFATEEPELLDEDARGLKDDGDPEGSWADLAERETVGVYDDDGRFDVRVCRENLEE